MQLRARNFSSNGTGQFVQFQRSFYKAIILLTKVLRIKKPIPKPELCFYFFRKKMILSYSICLSDEDLLSTIPLDVDKCA